jgi:hypothetical protein
MNNDKDIKSFNDKGQRHELWKVYSYKGNLQFQRFYHNGKELGYEETYWYDYNNCSDSVTRKTYNL